MEAIKMQESGVFGMFSPAPRPGEWVSGQLTDLGLIASLTRTGGPEIGFLQPLEVEGAQVIVFRVSVKSREEFFQRLFTQDAGREIMSHPGLNRFLWQYPVAASDSPLNLRVIWDEPEVAPIIADFVARFLDQAIPVLHETWTYAVIALSDPRVVFDEGFEQHAISHFGEMVGGFVLSALKITRE